MKKIVADCDIPYLNGVLEPFAEIAYIKGAQICATDVMFADALVVRTRTRCDRALLEGSCVKLIITATIGYDHIDMKYCQQAGIEVITAAGCNARGVLQWFSGAIATANSIYSLNPSQLTIGVVGVGHVGSLIAQYSRMWGFNVLCCDPPRQSDENLIDFVTLDTIANQSDIITFHVPLKRNDVNATYHMADNNFFDRVHNETIIINSSRGEIIDTQALKAAICKKSCRCAIDTWENEPQIDRELLAQAFVATTHIAGYSAQGKANGTAIVVNTLASRFMLPITDWYPNDLVQPIQPSHISWEAMYSSINSYFDAPAESLQLKSIPGSFESIRNNYKYRTEYF